MIRKRLLIVVLLGTLAMATPCVAQSDDSNVFLNAPLLLNKKPKPGAPDVKAQPLAWPRLDAGAVLCRSEADLLKLAQRRRGEVVSGPVDCQILRTVTPITIVQRKAPGLTEVQTSDPKAGGAGWTDAFLPAKAPATARR
jgi:hypothetical protein